MDAWRRQFEVNFFGAVAVTRAVLPLVRRARGRIVMVSSIAGLIGQPFLSPYSASKHAMEAVGDALRIELAPDGVGVTLIEPGAIRTPIWRRGEENTRAVEAGMGAEVSARYLARLERVKAMALEAERKGLEPSVCARAIERALTARRAPARVILGADARIGAWAKRLLPSGVFDAVLRRAFGV
jgi:NAD(P)-dependent dehydrogenase (short-subunit alcohol dehydrogenase family)